MFVPARHLGPSCALPGRRPLRCDARRHDGAGLLRGKEEGPGQGEGKQEGKQDGEVKEEKTIHSCLEIKIISSKLLCL